MRVVMRVVILGAGLAGLTTAYLLNDEPVDVTILEARNRPGGRIWTQTIGGETRAEAGATWFGLKHEYIVQLLDELNIGYFPQAREGVSLYDVAPPAPPQRFHVPDNEPESYRIQGGSSALIHALAQHIHPDNLKTGDPVQNMDFSGPTVHVTTTANASYEADLIVSTLPPQLFVHTIHTTPALDKAWAEVASQTHTWMSDSIKFFASYPTRFWAEQSLSGMAFSHTGIITEMYDHSSADNTRFALKGFLSGQAHEMNAERRKAHVLKKLAEYVGPQALNPIEYGDVLWAQDPFTSVLGTAPLFPHHNNGHEMLRTSLFDGRLLMGGSETASLFPGYMDGAINSAHRIVAHIRAC